MNGERGSREAPSLFSCIHRIFAVNMGDNHRIGADIFAW